MASKKGLLGLVIITVVFSLLVRLYSTSDNKSRDMRGGQLLDNPGEVDNIPNSEGEDVPNNLQKTDLKVTNNPTNADPDVPNDPQIGYHDVPNDPQKADHDQVMQFESIKEKEEASNGEKDADEVEDEEEEDEEEDYDDYYDVEDGQAEALLRLFGHAHVADKARRHAMIDKMRKWMPRVFPVSYKKDMNEKTESEIVDKPPVSMKSTKPSTNLLSEDSLVRNCITGDVIGRVPGHLKTRPFSKRIGKSLTKSPENDSLRAASFNDIFHKKTWGNAWEENASPMSASGRGATLSWTQEVMGSLHSVISNVKSALGKSKIRLLDAPCGDMTWMRRFLETRDDVTYVGIDIVSDLIETHKKAHKNPNWTFMQLDVVQDDLPGAFDIIFSRTMLQHLYSADIVKVLHKFSQSGSKYLLMTSFPGQIYNSELLMDADNPGRVREVNFEIPPYSLVPPLCVQRDGPPLDFEGWKHFLGLWQLPLQQNANCDKLKHFKLMGTPQRIYSCVEWSPYIDLD